MTVSLSLSESAPGIAEADVLVIGVNQGPDGPSAAPGADGVDEALGGTLAGALAALGATGELEELTKIPGGGKLPASVILAVGLGAPPADGAPFDAETLRRAAGTALRDLIGNKLAIRDNDEGKAVTLALPATAPAEAEAVATGALLGGYSFRRYRSVPVPDLAVTLLTSDDNAAAVKRGQVIAAAVNLTRDLVNTAPVDLPPAALAAEAERVATANGVAAQVLDEAELKAGGYGGILAVGQGSSRPPRLVRLEYTHPEAARTVVFVGKGITFDSGGLSLKPSKSMETMKCDMSGAAAVLAATVAVAELGLPVNVVGYMPLAENMPSGAAQRPSDIITIFGGKTVEVLNTDAEGRLVLADGMARSAGDRPDLLVDVATLTGAATVALGRRTAGVMGSADPLAAEVAAVMREAGEPAWAMPLPEELRKGLDSTVADLANVSADRNGGMLVAGLFLREFVPAGVAWAHLDIAGPAFNDGSAYGYTPKGGTGAAVRALVQIAAQTAAGRLPGA
ncbi:leucyl aminopeptidase [Trebonia sp.]|uniref:leucyl aminopeptidase n=1 Tax=Trebonia sp. TaxID=2767075 RepID=UPI00262C23C1|nr:leucyl aminopeptidase [Trebonia sp.]